VIAALKPIYQAPTADAALLALDTFEAGPWGQKYAAIAPLWRRQWDQVIPFFAFPPEGAADHLHHQCHREPQQHLTQRRSQPRTLPDRRGGGQTAVSGLAPDREELEECSTRMDRRHDPVRHHVRRPVQRRVEGSSETDPSHKIPDRITPRAARPYGPKSRTSQPICGRRSQNPLREAERRFNRFKLNEVRILHAISSPRVSASA